VCHLNLCIKTWGSPSSFRRKRPVISLKCSAFIENLPSSEGARARARATRKKWCAKRMRNAIEGNHLKRMFKVIPHSRPQSPRSFWSAPGIKTSGRDRSRKSANHGLPAFVRSLRNLNNNGYYWLQKWAAIALVRYLAPARGLDPWRRPKGSWALETRMGHSPVLHYASLLRPILLRHFRALTARARPGSNSFPMRLSSPEKRMLIYS